MDLIKRVIKSLFLRPARDLVRVALKKLNQLKKPRFDVPTGDRPGVLGCRIAYTAMGGFCVPLSSLHRPAAQKILKGLVYEPKTIEFLAANCDGNDIVHAGTYFGDFLPELSRACPSSKVWAFEPNRESFRCATVTCAINGLKNVVLTNAGLGAREETQEMLTRDTGGRSLGGASRVLIHGREVASGQTDTIRIVALDDVIPADRSISIIQLDVEGYEQQALTGALKTIARCLPILVLETLPDRSWLDVEIMSLGYSVGSKVHSNSVLLPPAR